MTSLPKREAMDGKGLRTSLNEVATSLEANSSAWGSNRRGLGHNNYLGKILNARVYDIANETPLQHAPLLSAECAPASEASRFFSHRTLGRG